MDALSLTFAALSDPTRRAILARLAEGETTVSELATPFDMSLPAISKHLKVLERAGLVVRGREARWRPCRLEAAPLAAASDWMAPYRAFWEQRLDNLENYLHALQTTAASSASADTEKTAPKKSAGTAARAKAGAKDRMPKNSSPPGKS